MNDMHRLSASAHTASLSNVELDMNGAAPELDDDDMQREDEPTSTETVEAPDTETSTDHVALDINEHQILPRPTFERQDEATPDQDDDDGAILQRDNESEPTIKPLIVTRPNLPPYRSLIQQHFDEIWCEYDKSARLTKAIAAQPPNAAGLASGLFQLRTGLAIFDTLIDVSIQPALFSRNSMATVDAYVPACPHDAAPLIGTATTQALNSCDAVDKAGREVNSWCIQAESFLAFAIEAVRDDNLKDATTVAVELCRSGVEVMQKVATAMHSCIDTLKDTAVMYEKLAALHKTSAKTNTLTNGELGNAMSFEPDVVEWANVLQRHVRRIANLVDRIEIALTELQNLRVVEALESYLEHSVSLETLDPATLEELTIVSDAHGRMRLRSSPATAIFGLSAILSLHLL
ncbi:hypothetical protein SDRG_11438 [Saprolegnia diclina VS20]|uniref:Uncharacterized protein n=1 Tax=Saprolegnia diclina (strain VS20) TaxID=1156394 RepID=T0QBS7_SAPDV|nr:hypothetical protein SDRG_11438 [Saprolegnia diclina VS20]EQC30965.1 hypothetical protein SDRG_11438 [Saprolegnia diclina VS20]|eukprot:XP_008615703.1 hypothetical protein SDRG_11438 [Saprolegnia diclina VS20]